MYIKWPGRIEVVVFVERVEEHGVRPDFAGEFQLVDVGLLMPRILARPTLLGDSTRLR